MCVCFLRSWTGSQRSADKTAWSVWAPIVTGTRRENAVCAHSPSLSVSLMVLMTAGLSGGYEEMTASHCCQIKREKTHHITQQVGGNVRVWNQQSVNRARWWGTPNTQTYES